MISSQGAHYWSLGLVTFLCAMLYCSADTGAGAGSGIFGGSLADRIVHHAKLAARYKNQGKRNEAGKEFDNAKAAFNEAIAQDPDDPQAYLNMAIFQSNINHFADSFTNFKKALSLVKGNPTATAQIRGAFNRGKYGYYSMKRDRTYKDGNGNISEAYSWALKQLEVAENPELILHQVATLEMMLCERNASKCSDARRHFENATNLACEKYRDAVDEARANDESQDVGASAPCKAFACLKGSEWKKHKDIRTKEPVPGVFLHTTERAIIGRGMEGTLSVQHSTDCSALLPSADFYLNTAENLLPHGTLTTRGILDSAPVLSLTQFAGSAYYHWMAEAIPRLVIAKMYWPIFLAPEDHIAPKILVPTKGVGKGMPGFINKTFTTLFTNWGVDWSKRLVEYHPGIVYSKGGAFVNWDEQPCPQVPEKKATAAESGAQSAPTSRPSCSSLAHPEALRLARSAIYESLGEKRPATPYVLVAMRGGGVIMRNYDEETFVEEVIAAVTDCPFGSLGIRKFDSGDYSFVDALHLFRGAKIVVGVHGGALSNIIACEAGTHLVEIGFKTAAARHYQHMSDALGLHYHFLPVNQDPLDRALGAENITFSTKDTLRTLYSVIKELHV